jgi:hypothetical protein
MALIKSQMEEGAPPEDLMPPEQEAVEDEGADESDPGFQAALKFAMDALYKNGAADSVAKQLSSAQSVSDALADVAYEIVSVADEKSQGAVPDELLVLLATNILEEVGDIAQAASVQLKNSDIALALKKMILRYLGESGVDTTQLQAAMDEVDATQFDTEGEDVEQEMPDEEEMEDGEPQK